MDVLRAWQDASSVVLSCPGPMRRHPSALMPVSALALPQVLLGGESQLLAFAAAMPDLAGRLFFAALPEMFAGPIAWNAAWEAVGKSGLDRSKVVHLRFGSVRDARILKAARNAAVVAECRSAPQLNASHHPFASGEVLPAAMRRVFVYGPDCLRPRDVAGSELPATRLPASCIAADLAGNKTEEGKTRRPEAPGLEIVSLADFRSFQWASGRMRPKPHEAQTAGQTGTDPVHVLVPWNLAHFGSIVPELLARLLRLRQPGAPIPHMVVMPFNYLGQTGMIRRLIAQLRDAAPDPDVMARETYLARLNALSGLKALTGLTRLAWVDGNDPEHWWTMARLKACGIEPILIDADPSARPDKARLVADEMMRVDADTRYGALSFEARLPSLRALAGLLALTAERTAQAGPVPRRARAVSRVS